MGELFEVVTRWDDTLLDVAHVGAYALGDVELVRDGKLVGDAAGRVGHVAYAIRAVPPLARTLPFTRGDDRRVAPYAAVVLALHLGIYAAAESSAPELTHPGARPARPVHVSRAFAHADHAPERLDARDVSPDTRGHGQAAAMQGAAGAAGAPAADAAHGHVAVHAIGEEPQLARAAQIEHARHAGILGDTPILDEAFRALAGPDSITSAFDAASVHGSLDGDRGASQGVFGLARSGFGESGGGNTYGTIGLGTSGAFSGGAAFGHGWGGHTSTDTSATWSGGWQRADYVPAVPIRHLREITPLMTICGEPYRDHCRVTGALDAAIVRRYVRRQRDRLQYCYEKALLATPALAGVVLVDFTVGADGKVAGGVTASGLTDEVASCVAGQLAPLELPAAPLPTRVEYALVYRPHSP